MPGLSTSVKIIFESAGPSTGDQCDNCQQPIQGEKFTGILQAGTTIQLNIAATKLTVCKECSLLLNKK